MTRRPRRRRTATRLLTALAIASIVAACQAGVVPSTGARGTGPQPAGQQPTGATPAGTPGPGSSAGSPTADPASSAASQGAAITAIAVSQSDVCAVYADGTVACWDPEDPTPVLVAGITDATAISANVGYDCVLRTAGTVACWGLNATGQLGDGTLVNAHVPVAVSGVSDAVAIEAGQGHACAVISGGGVMCWGNNGSGQLGNGTLSGEPTPNAAPVLGIDDAVALAAGGTHTCALRTNGSVKCWGNGVQLGNGSTSPLDDATAAVAVSGIGDAVAISAGRYDTCVVLALPPTPEPTPTQPPRNNVKCWGLDISELDETVFRPKPVAIPGIDDATAVAAGLGHVCVIRTAGVACWGKNEFGALGEGIVDDSAKPVALPNVADPAAISTTGWLTCVLTGSGSVECWG